MLEPGSFNVLSTSHLPAGSRRVKNEAWSGPYTAVEVDMWSIVKMEALLADSSHVSLRVGSEQRPSRKRDPRCSNLTSDEDEEAELRG